MWPVGYKIFSLVIMLVSKRHTACIVHNHYYTYDVLTVASILIVINKNLLTFVALMLFCCLTPTDLRMF